MKERPILFSGEMVRAILAGRKTQTRRTLKIQPYENGVALINQNHDAFITAGPDYGCKNPYGHPGDRLWVKETFMPDPYVGQNFIYRATEPDPDRYNGHKWKPSIFCTRKASRLTLEIVAVRVERLRQISEADALAEGVTSAAWSAVESYFTLWESINGKTHSWESNPWVWVIEFRKLEAAR